MKTMKYFGMLLMGAVIAFSLTACGDDDDNDSSVSFGGGSASVTVNGTTFSASRAYWHIDTANANDTFYELMIMNCSLPSITDPWVTISVLYHVAGGSTSQMVSGEFDDYQVSLSYVSSDDSKDRSYIAFGKQDGNSGKVKVSVSGNNISVEVPALKYTNALSSGTTTYDGGAFTFSGSMSKIPES
ncbi:MAG: hypothetical protein II822_04795 [Prevotella sp.]|nr:hypothetical protein [Prevotella sp.]